MNNARLRLFELAAEAAFLIATSPDPALARQKFVDDLTEELVAGKRNLEGSGPLREAFRDAMGYSVRVPDDALGEQEPTGREAGSSRSPVVGEGAGTSPPRSHNDSRGTLGANPASCSPSASSGRDSTLPATHGPPPVAPGNTGLSRPPNALRLVRGAS